MGKPYPLELRKQLVGYVLDGHSVQAAACRFGVSESTATRFMAAYRQNGCVRPKRQGHTPGTTGKLAPHIDFLFEEILSNPNMTHSELADALAVSRGVRVDPSSIGRALRRNKDRCRERPNKPKPHCLEGSIEIGDRRGRTIGFPTANLSLRETPDLVLGVYAVHLHILEGEYAGVYDGVANIGRRPTFDNGKIKCEVHIFDFDADVYGVRVSVELIDYVRAERKFDNIAALKSQIALDCWSAKAYLAQVVVD